MRKQCSKCKRTRIASCFKKDHRYFKGLFCWCADCESSYSKSPEVAARRRERWKKYISDPINKEKERIRKLKRYSSNPDTFKDNRYKNLYGISLKKFKMVKKCLLCKRKNTRLVVDHNHDTKKYRGVLCVTCNLMIGWFEGIPNSIQKIQIYLQRG